MKKSLKILGIVLLVIALIVATYLIINDNLSKDSTVIIEKYIPYKNVKIKTKYITEQEDIEKLDEFFKELKPLEDHKMIDIVVTNDIVISYKGKGTIIVMEAMKGICAYNLPNAQRTYLSEMPEGMYEWAIDKIK